MFKTEQELMEELMESIFSGNVDSDDSEEKDESTEEESEEKSEKSEKEESKEESSEESNDDGEEASEESDDDSSEESDDDDGESEGESDGDDNDFGKGGGDGKSGPFTSKIRSLQKQYNDLLVDAFEKYAPECIEDALDETESAFGENIEDILQNALDKLKGKIMGDLGVEGSSDLEGMEGMMPPSAMGSFDPDAGADKPMEIQIDKVG